MKRWGVRLAVALVAAVGLVGTSATLADARTGTFVPLSAGMATDGSGSASATYSSDESGAGALDVAATMTDLDPGASPADAFAEAGGSYQLDGNFPAGDYEGTITVAHVHASAEATGTGIASAQVGASAYCYPCDVTAGTVEWIVATPATNGGPGTPSQVSDATFTVHVYFTLPSARTSIEVGASTAAQVSSEGAVPVGDYGSGHVQYTGTVTRASVHRLHATP